MFTARKMQSDQEKNICKALEFSWGCPNVFEPDTRVLEDGNTWEPADLIWAGRDTATLLFASTRRRSPDMHNFRQACRTVDLWQNNNKILGENSQLDFILEYGKFNKILVISVIGGPNSTNCFASNRKTLPGAHLYLTISDKVFGYLAELNLGVRDFVEVISGFKNHVGPISDREFKESIIRYAKESVFRKQDVAVFTDRVSGLICFERNSFQSVLKEDRDNVDRIVRQVGNQTCGHNLSGKNLGVVRRYQEIVDDLTYSERLDFAIMIDSSIKNSLKSNRLISANLETRRCSIEVYCSSNSTSALKQFISDQPYRIERMKRSHGKIYIMAMIDTHLEMSSVAICGGPEFQTMLASRISEIESCRLGSK